MPTHDFGGTGGSSSSTRSAYYPIVSGSFSLPAGRLCADGTTRAMMTAIRAKISGYATTVNPSKLRIGSATTSSFSIPYTSGVPTAFRGAACNSWLFNGGTSSLKVYGPSGTGGGLSGSGTRFERGGGGTTEDTGGGTSLSGTIDGQFDYALPPLAPTLDAVVSAGPTSATVSWTPDDDDGDSAITGYRIVYANNVGFSGASTLDVGATTSTVVAGLTPGQWWFKVASLNAVTSAASTSSVFSAVGTAVLSGDVGDLDGWSPFGTLPGGLTPLVGDGLRRGAVYPLGASAPTGLLREIQCTGSGSVAAGALGFERTFTGLTVGRTYKLNGTALSLQDTTPAGNLYRFAVTGIGAGSNVTTSDTTHPEEIPEYTFVATLATHVLRVELNEAAAWSGDGWFEAVGFYGITLTEIPNPSPLRLQDVALEASLKRHFTVACDTVGAVWWVDTDDVTQFRQVPDDSAVRAIFTDRRAPGELEYVDLAANYDTRNVVNDLEVTNHGRDAATGNVENATYNVVDGDSVTAWGVRAGVIEMCLRSGYVDQINLIHHPIPATSSGWAPHPAVTGSYPSNNPRNGGPVLRGTRTTTAATSLTFEEGTAALNLEVGQEYTVAVWVRSNIAATIELIPRRASTTTAVDSLTAATLVANTWTRISNTFTVGDSADTPVQFAIRWSNGAVGNWLEACDPVLVEGDTAGDYIDGSFADDSDLVYEWVGPVNASASQRRTFALLNDRLTEIVDGLKTPQRVISSITWNAQEDPALAAAFDLQDRIRVRFRGVSNDYRVVGMRHSITAKRWLVTFSLAPS
jgi:hypothetical protein